MNTDRNGDMARRGSERVREGAAPRRSQGRREAERRTSTGAPVLLTVPEACERLRISRWMLYRLIHEKKLRTVQIGTRRLIEANAVAELIGRLAEEGVGEP